MPTIVATHALTRTLAPEAPAAPPPAPPPALAHLPPNGVERRRPGRMENASPELIRLMRKPSSAARVRLALYDAPSFILPAGDARSPARYSLSRLMVACAACGGAAAAAFKTMLVFWG